MPVLQKKLHFRLVAWVASGLLRAMYRTWRVQVSDPQNVLPGMFDGSRPGIVAFWHRHILSMLTHFRGAHVCVPVSEHRDGEYIAHVMERFGFESVRGSTTRGAARLLKGLMGRIREGWTPALTPDGPRGPRFSVRPGFTVLARRSGLPVYPIGLAVEKAWVMSSWDAFIVPRPFTRIAIKIGAPLRAEDFEEVPDFCSALQAAMFEATDEAERALTQKPSRPA